MKNNRFFTLLSITVIIVFITSLVSTVNVLADDSTPPASTEELVSTEEPVASEEPVSTEEPAATEEPVVDVSPTEVPAVTDVVAEDLTVPEVLDQLPEGTDLVVLDQNGEALPLASEAAADVLASGDPYFDDGTQIVGFSVSGSCPPIVDLCTADPNPIQAAVDAFAASSAPIGNIIVEADSYAGNVTIDGTGNLANLTGIIGAGSTGINMTTINGSLEISDMNAFTLEGFTINGKVWAHDNSGTLTLNDLIVTNTSGDGIYVEDQDGDVNLTSVNSSGNEGYGAFISTTNGGDVKVTDSEFNDNRDSGLVINTQDSITDPSGNVTLTNVHANLNNTGDFNFANADIMTEGGDVTIIGSEFNDNYHNDGYEWGGDGLDVFAYNGGPLDDSGNITLNSVTASNNYNVGADLENGCGCVFTTGSIFITSSSFDHNGDFITSNSDSRGLIAHSYGDIILSSVTANQNGGGGAELDNSGGIGSIILSGTNVFNNNGFSLTPSVGLYAVSDNNITLSGVTADGNGFGFGGGAFIGSGGSISIANSNFSNNCVYCEAGVGLIAFGQGDITLNNVTANNNGNDPTNGYTDPSTAIGAAVFSAYGDIFVVNSNFNNNCTLGDCEGGGIQVLAYGNVYFDHVNANGNGISDGGGAMLLAGDNVDIYCSTFSNNAGDGLDANFGGTMTLNGVTFGGNAGVDVNSAGGTVVENPFDCSPGGGRDKKPVPVSAGVCVGLAANASFKTPKGDFATFPCPINDQVSVQLLDEDKLPGELGDGQKFLSALVTNVIRDNKPVDELENAALISFIIPEGVDQTSLAILFWDGTQWTELGGELSADGLRFEVFTKLVGTFVLVSK